MRGATRVEIIVQAAKDISIHAPREGCDRYHRVVKLHDRISIHAPREGCDTLVGMSDRRTRQFQSTHPVRGANANTYDYNMWTPFQSTHPVRGATRLDITRRRGQRISIHAPREGCDNTHSSALYNLPFQSTHPVRGAIVAVADRCRVAEFQSTHPVRGATARPTYFVARSTFQSTHPVRGASGSAWSFNDMYHFNPRTP